MQVVITARHLTLTDSMKERIETKTGKLLKYYDRIKQIEVVVERHDTNCQIECIVRAEPSIEIVAHATADEFLTALDSLVDKLERQLSDHKERFRNRKHPPQ
jgi:putative sigma-54 modulation protein